MTEQGDGRASPRWGGWGPTGSEVECRERVCCLRSRVCFARREQSHEAACRRRRSGELSAPRAAAWASPGLTWPPHVGPPPVPGARPGDPSRNARASARAGRHVHIDLLVRSRSRSRSRLRSRSRSRSRSQSHAQLHAHSHSHSQTHAHGRVRSRAIVYALVEKLPGIMETRTL